MKDAALRGRLFCAESLNLSAAADRKRTLPSERSRDVVLPFAMDALGT